MILTCLYLTGCGREEVPYLDTTQTQEQTVETERTEQKETLKSDQTVQVYVCGEVAAPGVYQLKDGMRICDAVEAAGGLTKAASREYWNLAEKLSDGQMIYFPTEEEARERKASAEAAGATVEESDGRIDINTADATQLVTIPGIGETRAAAILAYREKNGPFAKVEDIMQVSGIKSALFEKMKDYITIRWCNMAKKVLVVDDEKLIVKGIRFSLEQDGMEVDCAYDGEEALNMAKANEYDMILLDIMLPKMDGFEVCQAIREFSDMPIVMLTAKGDDMDKILGLDYGADDYITKPFNILEVKARIKAIMRRTAGPREKKEVSSIVEKGDLRLDCDSRRLFISGREVNLTAKEFDLLELLVKNENKVYSRENLLGLVWGKDYPGDVRTVDVHVRRLREKIETNPSEPKYVHTKWGVGYYYYQK